MEKKTLTIRSAEPKDYPDILRLNADNVSVLAPMDGEGIRRFADWAELLEASANRGNQWAQYLLGKLLLQGKQVERDRDAATDYPRQIAFCFVGGFDFFEKWGLTFWKPLLTIK